MVEAKGRCNQRMRNDVDLIMNKHCRNFINNLNGMVFYGVPHGGGTKEYFTYFKQQCQKIYSFNKMYSKTQPNLLMNVQVFNRQMEELSVTFDQVKTNLIVYAFGEGEPINKNEASFQSNYLESYANFHYFETFLICDQYSISFVNLPQIFIILMLLYCMVSKIYALN